MDVFFLLKLELIAAAAINNWFLDAEIERSPIQWKCLCGVTKVRKRCSVIKRKWQRRITVGFNENVCARL